MSVKRGGLGRNLSVLLGQSEALQIKTEPTLPQKLPVTALQPGKYQPRIEMNDEALAELAASIKKQGLLQPLVVRSIAPNKYEIIAGERRWRASQLAGFEEIPVIIKDVNDETAMAMALVENLQREDLNAIDQARAMHRLTTEFGLTHQQVADILSKSRAAVSNFLRLLNLNPDVRCLLENGDLDMGHARCLLMLQSEQQSQAAKLIVAKNLSVREAENLVSRIKSGSMNAAATTAHIEVPWGAKESAKKLANHLQTKIQIKPGKHGGGTLIIQYEDFNKLDKMMNQLMES